MSKDIEEVKKVAKVSKIMANVNYILLIATLIGIAYTAFLGKKVADSAFLAFFMAFFSFWINKSTQEKAENMVKELEEKSNGKSL